VNPASNRYDWAALDKWVEEITAVPHMGFAFFPAVFNRMLDGDRGVHTGKQFMAPHWLETEGWQGRKVRFYKDGEPTGWEPDSGYLGALEAFLGALAERYAKHPRFTYIDIRCIDHIYGEGQLQGASTKAKMDDLEKDYGYPREYEYINSERGAVKVKNFERRLMQFDTAPDGMTQPALRTDTFQKAWDRKDRSPDKLWGQSHGGASQDAEFWGRRTDHATGQNAVYFRADPKWFQAYTGAARLFVTYQDTNASSWRLEYQDRSGARQQSPVVTTGNSGKLRTVTLELPSLAAKGGFAGTNDNGDGLDFDGCQGVRVSNSAFDTSDDSICLQTSRPDRPCRDVTISNCIFVSQWAGIRIGLLSRGDFRNAR